MIYSLRFKINAAILLTFILIAILFGGILVPFQKKNKQEGINKTKLMLSILAKRENNALANEIFEKRPAAIDLRIQELMEVPGIIGVAVFDSTGRIIHASEKALRKTPLSLAEQELIDQGAVTHFLKWNEIPVMAYYRKIEAIGETMGFVVMHYSMNDIMKEQRYSYFIFLSLLVSILFMMMVVLNVILSKTVLDPITKLKKLTYQIIREGPGRKVSIENQDEIGELANSFNNMSESLMQSNQQVEAQAAELWNTKNYLDSIINSMPSVLIGVDIEGNITQWNKTAVQYTGIPAAKALDRKLVDVFPELSADFDMIRESIRKREPKKDRKRLRITKSGSRYEDIVIYPLIANNVEGAVVRVDDVTEKVRLEEMMVQSEKMLSVGGLAAGMAHEINNPLAGMIQNASVMVNRLNDFEMEANKKAAQEAGISMEGLNAYMTKREIFKMIAAVKDSGRRIAEIVGNMLSFARKTEGQRSTHLLVDLLEKTLDLAATDFNLKKNYDFKAINIIRTYEDQVPPVACEGAKIQQVLLNIFRNGAYAMQVGKTQSPTFSIRTWFNSETQMACMSIKDNGPGMSEEVRKRVFEPFFTTKSVGVGTGIGLSVSYFIITENHSGEMNVQSSPGNGAEFIIGLPVSVS